jgi:DNA (cytosine-5)-methyltransferase 1
MLHISLFSGIGGFDLAAEWAGWTNIVSCEINPFGNKVLNHYWPEAYHHTDIHTLTIEKINEELTKRHGANWRTNDIVLTGGFPCQPYSLAGKRLGKEDERHLWPEMLRVIREIKPDWIVGENVFGLVNWSDGLVFDEVQTDLEAAGYEVQAYVLPACAANAPHRRDRVWIVAKNTMRSGCVFGGPGQERTETRQQRNACAGSCNGICLQPRVTANAKSKQNIRRGQEGFYAKSSWINDERLTSNSNNQRLQRGAVNGGISDSGTKRNKQSAGLFCANWHNFPTEPPVRSRDDGFSGRLDGITFSKWRNESIKAAGNAIVPQIAFRIFETINQYNQQTP